MTQKNTGKTFEQKNIINQIISYESFNIEYHLVLVSGIYYRYQIYNALQLEKNMIYKVIGNNGNILLLKKL